MSNWCYNPTSTYRDTIESVSRRKYIYGCCIVVPMRPLCWGYNQRSATVIRYHLGIELVPEWLCSDGRGIWFQCAQWTASFQNNLAPLQKPLRSPHLSRGRFWVIQLMHAVHLTPVAFDSGIFPLQIVVIVVVQLRCRWKSWAFFKPSHPDPSTAEVS